MLSVDDRTTFRGFELVYQQHRRWLAAGYFEALVDDLRLLLRQCIGRRGQPSAAILDSWTLQSTPESGGRAGYDGNKRRKGSKVHLAVATLGHLLALLVSPQRPAVPRSSERPAASRDHWAVGRPSVRNWSPVFAQCCGQPAGESSQVSCRPYTVMSNSP
jgi:hypothetical protein